MSTADLQNATLDALAVLLAAERGDADAVDAMFATYRTDTAEYVRFVSAIVANAVCAVRQAACMSGIAPERLLAGIAATVRGDVTSE